MAVKKSVKGASGHPTEFAGQDVLKKYYKKLSTQEVEAWVSTLGASFNPSVDPSIHRMRACMAVLYHFFPKEVKAKKSSKYSSYTLEELVILAADNNVPVEITEDERILRMRTIMALRAHKVIE